MSRLILQGARAGSRRRLTDLIGDSSIAGKSLALSGSGYLFGQVLAAAASGTIAGIRFYLQNTGASDETFAPILYETSSGNPTNLLASGTDYTLAAGQIAGWVDLPFSSTAAISAGTDYLIGLHSGGTASQGGPWTDTSTGSGFWVPSATIAATWPGGGGTESAAYAAVGHT